MTSASQRGQSYTKYWIFTINNPESNEVPNAWPDVAYAVWQREVGAAGTEHLQGYVVFEGPKRRTWTNRSCTPGFWEPRKGSHHQAKHYNTKPHASCQCVHCEANRQGRLAGPWELGEEQVSSQQGKRNDLLVLKRKLDEGKTETEIATSDETFPVWCKYRHVVKAYRVLTRQNARDWATFTTVYWGPPGVGKTRRALSEAGLEAYWLPKPSPNQTAWFDGYEGQEVVVIDEFYGWLARDLMCRMCDRYPLLVQTKGGTVPFLPKKIIITSNEHPCAWWPKVGLGPMERRLTGELGKIEEMVTPWVPEIPAPQTPLEAPAAPPVCPGAPTRRALEASEGTLSESHGSFGPGDIEGVEWYSAPLPPAQEMVLIEDGYIDVGAISYDDW